MERHDCYLCGNFDTCTWDTAVGRWFCLNYARCEEWQAIRKAPSRLD